MKATLAVTLNIEADVDEEFLESHEIEGVEDLDNHEDVKTELASHFKNSDEALDKLITEEGYKIQDVKVSIEPIKEKTD